MNSKIADITVSKNLSYILRHGAVERGITIQPDGYVTVKDILKVIPDLKSIDNLKRIVNSDQKQRFSIRQINDKLMIKANQGHSIATVNHLSLKILTEINFDVIHGTYKRSWEIIKSHGLHRMNRNHIHFAKGLNFICGLRKQAEIFIYIDFLKAQTNGLTFYESENGVILSQGDSNGYIHPKYFLKVITKYGENIQV